MSFRPRPEDCGPNPTGPDIHYPVSHRATHSRLIHDASPLAPSPPLAAVILPPPVPVASGSGHNPVGLVHRLPPPCRSSARARGGGFGARGQPRRPYGGALANARLWTSEFLALRTVSEKLSAYGLDTRPHSRFLTPRCSIRNDIFCMFLLMLLRELVRSADWGWRPRPSSSPLPTAAAYCRLITPLPAPRRSSLALAPETAPLSAADGRSC